ncbi:MAG: sulfotransferase [Planctomycetia bacterium]|nr:sulfotransferase [Planctomycetia bacterium]
MAKVEVLQVAPVEFDRSQLEGFHLDAPRPGDLIDAYSLELAGWVLGRRAPVKAVEAKHLGRVIRRAEVWMPRGDALPLTERAFNRLSAAVRGCTRLLGPVSPRAATERRNCGFMLSVNLIGLPAECELELQAVLADESVVPLAIVRARHAALRPTYQPRRQPILVSGLGRCGTTWLMHLLAEHPAIVLHQRYPFESLGAIHTMRHFQVLTTPANAVRHADIRALIESIESIGPMPLYCRAEDPAMHAWLRKEYVEHFADFALRLNDLIYDEVARPQGKLDCPYFSEKCQGGKLVDASLFMELYAAAKEIFLVRDFRDATCSHAAFKQKLGERNTGVDEGFLRHQQQLTHFLLAHWQSRRTTAHLVHYEDLVLRPIPTLQAIFTYLGIDDSTSAVETVLHQASTSEIGLENHLTAPDPVQSIGRWRHDLPLDLQQKCNELLADALEEFGYARAA